MGPVSDTGRAMMASLQQAMAKGMPIDQAIAYVKGMAQQGVAPMVDLYAMLNQFQRLKQPPAQMPQGGTIKDQIAAAAMQRDQQEAMQRGLASMAAQRAPQEPMQQGLGSVPAPAMEQAQFAGGGIVAFDDGGFITKPKEQDPFKPDPNVQRQIEEAARFGDYNYTRGVGTPNYGRADGTPTPEGMPSYNPSTGERIIGALRNAFSDPATYGAIAGGIMGGPLGAAIGGNAAGYINRQFTNEPNPITTAYDNYKSALERSKEVHNDIEPPPGLAYGGVIKMADGPPRDMFDYTDQNAVLANLQGQFGGDPTEYLTREAQAQEAAYERMGLGAARKAREEDIAEQKAEAERYAGSAAQTNLAQYFFDLAANASKPGARFLASAAQAAPGYGQRKTAIDEKTRLLNRSAKEGKLKLMEADELRKAGYLKEAEAKRQEGIKQMIQVGGNIAKEKGEMARAELSAKTSKEVARTYMTHTGSQAEIDRLTQIIATKPRYSEEYREAVERLKIIDPKQAALQTKLSISERNQIAGLYKEELKGLNKQLEKGIGLDDAQRATIQGKIDAIKEEAASIGIDQKELTDSAGFYGAGIVNPLAPNQNVLMPQRGPVIRPINAQGNIPSLPRGYRLDQQ
jgi:hypothetical protein